MRYFLFVFSNSPHPTSAHHANKTMYPFASKFLVFLALPLFQLNLVMSTEC